MPGVQPHVRMAGLVHPPGDRLGHHVARCQVGELVHALHEAVTLEVHEERALAADGLGDQRLLAAGVGAEVHHRRVELHELQVPQRRPDAGGDGHPVAGRHRGVGGLGEHLAEPAGRQHHRAAVHGADTVALALPHHVQGDAGDARRGVADRTVEQQVDGQGVLDDLDLGGPLDGGDQGPLDLGPGRVAAGVRDAVAVVAALAGEAQLAVRLLVEDGAQGDQLVDGGRSLGHQRVHGGGVAGAGAGHQGVPLVVGGGVLGSERGRDPALRPLRRAGVEDVLGDHQQLEPTVRSMDAERRGQPGDARPDDHHVGPRGPAGLRGGQTLGDAPAR